MHAPAHVGWLTPQNSGSREQSAQRPLTARGHSHFLPPASPEQPQSSRLVPTGPRPPYRPLLERPAQVVQVGLGTPDFSDEALVGHVEAAHVQHVVNGFHLLHLDDVAVDGFGGFTQYLP